MPSLPCSSPKMGRRNIVQARLVSDTGCVVKAWRVHVHACFSCFAIQVARLSYAELMAWANDIASKIAETGVQRAFRDYLLVALLADRSLLAVAAIFGIWQAGGAYAPVPKDAPTARQKVLCFEADLVVTDSVEKCNEFQCALLIGSSLMDTPKDWRIPNPEQTCMVIYTSGSTGRPKGVLCSHKCLWHSVRCFIEDIDANANSRLLWKTPYQWRTAEYEIFSPLCVGGTLYISPEGSQRQLRNLAHLLHFHSITAFTAVPSVLSSFVNYLGQHSLSHVAAVGEPLPSTLCKPCLDNGIILRNYYGLTETAMTTWVCTRVPSSSVAPAGRPQPEAQVMLLSHPEGDPQQEGEIFFSGIMSQGYLNMPELTAQLFHEAGRCVAALVCGCFASVAFGTVCSSYTSPGGRRNSVSNWRFRRVERRRRAGSLGKEGCPGWDSDK